MANRSNRSIRQDSRNLDILLRVTQGESRKALALEYGISLSRVLQIIQKEQKWLDRGYDKAYLNSQV